MLAEFPAASSAFCCPFIFRGSTTVQIPVTASLLIVTQAQELNET